MKYATIPVDTFSTLQLGAGVICGGFDTTTKTVSNILGATDGGITASAVPTFIDLADGIDNASLNTKEGKDIDYWTCTISGTFKTVTTTLAKKLFGAADIAGNKVTPRRDIQAADFADVWFVGDYSDVNTGANAGYIAIHLINALNTNGFTIQSENKGKGSFSCEFTGHTSSVSPDVVPFEVYIESGEADSTELASLTIGTLTLSPSFNSSVLNYSTTTTNASDTITATARDNTASVTIVNGSTTVSSGNAASWSSGNNAVTVTVTKGGQSRVYNVVVVKSGA